MLQAGNNLLHHAVHSGMFEAVKFCVEKGVNPEQMNDSAQTAVDIADDYKKFRGVFRDIFEYLGSVSTGVAWVGPKDATDSEAASQHPGFGAAKMGAEARVFVFARGKRHSKKLEISFTSQWYYLTLDLWLIAAHQVPLCPRARGHGVLSAR